MAEAVTADVHYPSRKVSTHQLTIGDAQQVAAVVDNAALVLDDFIPSCSLPAVLPNRFCLGDDKRAMAGRNGQDLNGFVNVMRATLPRLRAWGGGSM
jgi:hypothetical protein